MTYIYESPDHGNTIYRRKIGDNNRELYKQDETKRAREDQWIMWRAILDASKSNPALKEALDSAQIIYELSRVDNV